MRFTFWELENDFGRVVRNDGTKKLTTGLFEKKKSGMRDGQSCRKSQGKWCNVWHLKEESIFLKNGQSCFFGHVLLRPVYDYISICTYRIVTSMIPCTVIVSGFVHCNGWWHVTAPSSPLYMTPLPYPFIDPYDVHNTTKKEKKRKKQNASIKNNLHDQSSSALIVKISVCFLQYTWYEVLLRVLATCFADRHNKNSSF